MIPEAHKLILDIKGRLRTDTIVHLSARQDVLRVFMSADVNCSEVKLEVVLSPVSSVTDDDESVMLESLCGHFNEMIHAKLIEDYKRGKEC